MSSIHGRLPLQPAALQPLPRHEDAPQSQTAGPDDKNAAGSSQNTSDLSYNPRLMRFEGGGGSQPASPGSTQEPADYVVEQPALNKDAISTYLIDPLKVASEAYTEAKEDVDKLDEQLDIELADVGPSMTEEQRNAYAVAYHEKHADEYDKEKTAADALKAAIEDPRNDQAAADYPECADQIVEAVKLLAKSSDGQAALDWLAAKFGASEAGGGAAAGPYASLLDDAGISTIVETATASAASACLAADDPKAAMDQTVHSLQLLANAGAGGSGVTNGLKLLKAVSEACGSADGAAHLKKAFTDALDGEANPKIMAAAYVMTGAMVVAGLIDGVGSGGAEQAKFMADLALTAQGGMEAAGKLLSSGKSVFWTSTAEITKASAGAAGDFGKFLTRNAPILGGLASAFYIVADAFELKEDADVWKLGTFAGDVMSLALLIPGLQVVGWAGIAIASLFSIFGTMAANDERHAEEVELLKQIGIDPAAVKLFDENPDQVKALGAAGITFDQAVDLHQNHPEIFTELGSTQAFAELVAACELTGDEVIGLADAMANSPDGEASFTHLASDMKRDDGGTYSAAWIIDHVTRNDVYPGVAAYLQDLRPQLVAEAGVRAAADSAYDAGVYATMDDQDFVYGLGKQDDPLYRAQFIYRSVEDGTLGIFVDDLAATGNDESRQLLATGIRDAYDDGGISLDQANHYLKELGALTIEPAPASAPAPTGSAGVGQMRPV